MIVCDIYIYIYVSIVGPNSGIEDLKMGSSSSARDANVPFVKGENYNLWSLMMKTMLRSKDLWNLVEKGFIEEGNGVRINESVKKDAKALYLI